MIDTHCHMDLYPDPSQVARDAKSAGVGTIVVTNLPSAFDRAYPYIGSEKGIKLALGLHPLLARDHPQQRAAFQKLASKTCYIGEVGLDYSPQGYATKDIQIESFRFVLEVLRGRQKFITVHSRRAEADLLALLRAEGRAPVVFHWYSGSLKVMQEILADGHYFSINPGMIGSANGQKLISHLPADRILTESDGPFVTIGPRPAYPWDVAGVEDYLADQWGVTKVDAGKQIKENFVRLRTQLGGLDHC